jgi:hypothetical protein
MWWTYLNDFVVVIVVVGGSQSRDLRSEIGFAMIDVGGCAATIDPTTVLLIYCCTGRYV